MDFAEVLYRLIKKTNYIARHLGEVKDDVVKSLSETESFRDACAASFTIFTESDATKSQLPDEVDHEISTLQQLLRGLEDTQEHCGKMLSYFQELENIINDGGTSKALRGVPYSSLEPIPVTIGQMSSYLLACGDMLSSCLSSLRIVRESDRMIFAEERINKCVFEIKQQVELCYAIVRYVQEMLCVTQNMAPPSGETTIVESVKPSYTDGKDKANLSCVEFSAIAPKCMEKGEYSTVQVVMYEKEYRHIVDEIANQIDGASTESRSGIHQVKNGAEIKIVLSSQDINIDDDTEFGIWHKEYLIFTFAVCIPENYAKKHVLFVATVYVDDLIATKLKFIAQCSAPAGQRIEVTREDIVSAFVSYASQDRTRVASIIQGMQKARSDMKVFFDVESLRSGDNWEDVLHREIDKCDILFLCWSRFARDSKWVNSEWRYALARKGEDCIEPIPLESPETCPPPVELRHKHFNDKLLYIINSCAENVTNDQIVHPIVLETCSDGKVFAFYKEEIVVGRGTDCDMDLEQQQVSRRHAIIKRNQEGGYWLSDLGSRNGTTILEVMEKVPAGKWVQVSQGATIIVGGVTIRLR